MKIRDISVDWFPSHLAALRVHWKKSGPGTAMWPFNLRYQTDALSKRSDSSLLYVVGVKIPHLSTIAENIARQRGLKFEGGKVVEKGKKK